MGSSALSTPELTPARSVGRVHLASICIMLKFVLASCLAAASLAQFVDPEKAKILKEQRFNAGDGRFGAAYAQEDGTVYREETTADGERVGQYSYIDTAGKTITVRYTAGKDGFRILEGDHVPTGANGQGSAQFQATPRPAPAPRQQFVQQQQQQFVQPRESVDYDYEYYDGAVPETSPRFNQQAPAQQTFVPAQPVQRPVAQPVQRVAQPVQPVRRPVAPASNSNPFINPHDPTHRDFNFNRNGGSLAAAPHLTRPAPSPPAPTVPESTPSSTPLTPPTGTLPPSPMLPLLLPGNSSSRLSSSPSRLSGSPSSLLLPSPRPPGTSSPPASSSSTGSRTGSTSTSPPSRR